MKVSELTGAQLDYWVAKAQGWVDFPSDSVEQGSRWHTNPKKAPHGHSFSKSNWQPSCNWAQGGPIIEREGMATWKAKERWLATDATDADYFSGPTPLVAAMRAYVASKFGDEVTR